VGISGAGSRKAAPGWLIFPQHEPEADAQPVQANGPTTQRTYGPLPLWASGRRVVCERPSVGPGAYSSSVVMGLLRHEWRAEPERACKRQNSRCSLMREGERGAFKISPQRLVIASAQVISYGWAQKSYFRRENPCISTVRRSFAVAPGRARMRDRLALPPWTAQRIGRGNVQIAPPSPKCTQIGSSGVTGREGRSGHCHLGRRCQTRGYPSPC
jgi:hypothetical protein